MNPYHKVIQTYPTDRFQEKSIALTKSAAALTIDLFHYYNFNDAKPSKNKVEKHVADYIKYVMQDYKNLKLKFTDIRLVGTHLDELRPGILKFEISSVHFSIDVNGKKIKYSCFPDGTIHNARDGDVKFNDDAKKGLIECIERINVMLERGCMHACSELYQSGLWFTDHDLYSRLLFWLRSGNDGEIDSNEILVNQVVNGIVKSEINDELEIQSRLTIYGSDSESFPPFSPVIAIQGDGSKQSVFFPQHYDNNEWGIELATQENNINSQFSIDLNLMTIGVNKLISKIRKTRL